LEGENVKRGTKRLEIGPEWYIGGSMCLIVVMRPAPTLQLAFQMRTGVRHFDGPEQIG
jgi:hypothetical protein